MVHLRFFIYYYYRTYVGVCVTPFFFFLRRALCTVQSSCTVLFRCARPTHALHASSIVYFCAQHNICINDSPAEHTEWHRQEADQGLLLPVSLPRPRVAPQAHGGEQQPEGRVVVPPGGRRHSNGGRSPGGGDTQPVSGQPEGQHQDMTQRL